MQGGSSSQTHEICDVYLTEKELYQLNLDEEALRETLEEEARDEKERKEKIRQKQADDEEFMLEFGLKQKDVLHGLDGVVMSTYEESVWDTIKHFPEKENFDQVVSIVNLVSSNAISYLPHDYETISLCMYNDLSGSSTLQSHWDGWCHRKDITVGVALILANILVFSPKPFMHYLNITMRNVVKVFRKDTIPAIVPDDIHDDDVHRYYMELFSLKGDKGVVAVNGTRSVKFLEVVGKFGWQIHIWKDDILGILLSPAVQLTVSVVVPWETDNKSVLREACQTRASAL
ncbi:EEIG1/EHBP1 N-terminal domain-containing protein [Tanacetum coccineum]